MDLTAYTLQKLNREKRERQPNWTESEKQLLLSLTKRHQSILENKSSDTMTIKRKSEAWDDIVLRMNAAGYNRSKERLKQQLGRIRAAEAKKMKDAIERNLTANQVRNFQISNSIDDNPAQSLDTTTTESTSLNLPMSSQEDGLYIKIEEPPEAECRDDDIRTTNKGLNTTVLTTNATADMMDNMHFSFQNVQSLAKSDNEGIKDQTDENKKAFAINALNIRNAIPSTSASAKSRMTSMKNNDDNSDNLNSTAGSVINNQKSLQKRSRLRRMRLNGIRTPFTSKQCLRQWHLYRIAVERERLRNIKLQQKRDRILYRKDVEIQNLKLQILRNLTNQNRDTNRINW